MDRILTAKSQDTRGQRQGPTPGRTWLPPALLLVFVGGHGLVVQVVLLRELLAAFAGNELTAGLLVAVWLGAEALGAWLFGRARTGRLGAWLSSVGPVGALVSGTAAVAAVLGRSALGLVPGESIGMPALVAVTALAVSLPALAHGALFVLGTALEAERHKGSIGRGYVWEGLGTVLAALLTWLFLLGRVPGLALAALFGLPVAVLPALLPGRRWVKALAGGVVLLLGLAAWRANPIEAWSWERLWAGQRVVEVSDSPYGKVVRLEREEQRLVLYDGAAVFSVPPADPVFIEELAHLPLLAHPGPRRVLIVGAGARLVPGVLAEPVKRVVLVQIDDVLARAFETAADSGLRAAFADSRFVLVAADPVRFVATTRDSFDCIIVADVMPYSLAASRVFAAEFFGLCRQRLRRGGLLAAPGPGPGARAAGPSRDLLELRLATLRRAFPQVELIAADFPLLLASDQPVETAANAMAGRLKVRGFSARILDSSYVAGLLDPFRQEVLRAGLKPDWGQTAPSTYLRPREFLLAMLLEGRVSSPEFLRFYAMLGKARPTHLIVLGVLLLVCLVGLSLTKGRRFSRPAGVCTSGFAGAALTTLAVFGYQVRFGSVYSEVGLLLAGFMLGTVAGGVVGTAVSGRSRLRQAVFIGAELVLAVTALLLLLLVRAGPAAGFWLVLVLGGAGVGVQFPVAGAELPASPGRRAGLLAALDLAGGFVGALAVALFLVPVLGIGLACLAVAAVKLASAAGQPIARPASN